MTGSVLDILSAHDPLAAARAAAPAGGTPIMVRRGDAPAGWLVDGDAEGSLAEHRAAHAEGRPSEAVVAYGHGVTNEQIAARLEGLAALAADTGLLRAVCPVPREGTDTRPGSWGLEDLTIIAACRSALPDGVILRPSWRHLGPAACQIAIAFGATAWAVPADDTNDLAHLAAAIGRTVVEEPPR